MKYNLKRVGVLKAALIGGIMYALMALLFVPIFLFFAMVAGPMMGEPVPTGAEWLMGPSMMLLAPLIYGVIGFIGTAIGAAVYNLIAMMTGGLELELAPAGPVRPPEGYALDTPPL